MPNINEGYAFVGPRNSATARALLDSAAAIGEEAAVVRTAIGGYYVPESVARHYEQTLGAPAEEVVEESPETGEAVPDDSWKVAEIREWAKAHEVDLGDATKKADMLAAVRTADKEE